MVLCTLAAFAGEKDVVLKYVGSMTLGIIGSLTLSRAVRFRVITDSGDILELSSECGVY